jgi:hypothetical protein
MMRRQYIAEFRDRQYFIFSGQIWRETDKAFLIAPRDFSLPGPASAWFAKSETRILYKGGQRSKKLAEGDDR